MLISLMVDGRISISHLVRRSLSPNNNPSVKRISPSFERRERLTKKIALYLGSLPNLAEFQCRHDRFGEGLSPCCAGSFFSQRVTRFARLLPARHTVNRKDLWSQMMLSLFCFPYIFRRFAPLTDTENAYVQTALCGWNNYHTSPRSIWQTTLANVNTQHVNLHNSAKHPRGQKWGAWGSQGQWKAIFASTWLTKKQKKHGRESRQAR